EPLKATAEPIGQCAIDFKIDFVALRCLAFHALAGDRDRGAATRQLLLPFAENVDATEVGNDLAEDVAPASRPWTATVGFDEMRLAIGDAAPALGFAPLNRRTTNGRIYGWLHHGPDPRS